MVQVGEVVFQPFDLMQDVQISSPQPEVVASVPALTTPPAKRLLWDPELPPILVADDDADDTFFIERLIRKTGVLNRVMTFDDGTEVVNFLDRVRSADASQHHRAPLLLFLDLKMAGLGGFGFLEWARRKKELSPLTIVVLSNSSNPADMHRALELGAHRYLVKYPGVQTFATILRSVYPQKVY